MPADLVAIATLVALATLAAPLTADWRRRLATRRFDAVYERNLLRRTGRGERTSSRSCGGDRPRRPADVGARHWTPPSSGRYRAAPASAGSATRTLVTPVAGGVRRPRADRRSRASSTARV